jgi:signal transduction histidine kinase
MTQALILVVEDNTSLLEGLRELLEISGYRALTAADAFDALELLQAHRPDLIVSDIMMPGIDGYELYERVRQRPELLDVPFIFLTARGEKADIRRGKELGADDYITKPFEEEDLLIAVRAKLARSQALRGQREEQFSDLKRSILATLSHEFRTPLTYIINYSDLLGKESSELSSEEFKQFMQGIRKGAERLHRLVLDFITLVELQTGEAESAYHLRRRVIDDVSPWLRTVAKRHKKLAKERGLGLILQVPDGLPPIVADEIYLSNAIGRLVDNAIKFSKKDSTGVQFRAAEREGRLVIEVEDTGVGIRQNELGSLFNVFRQVDRSKQEQQGTGSGLAICKGIVDLHGGRVGATSQLGVGSTFWIELPSVSEPE